MSKFELFTNYSRFACVLFKLYLLLRISYYKRRGKIGSSRIKFEPFDPTYSLTNRINEYCSTSILYCVLKE